MSDKKLMHMGKITQQSDENEMDLSIQEAPVRPSQGTVNIKGWLALVVAGFAFLIYANSIDHGYVLDDFSVTKDNWVVKRGLEGIPIILETGYRYGYWNSSESLYRPVSLVMFAAEWEFFPDAPLVYHLVNVLCYALTGFLLFVVLSMMYGKINIVIPFVISLLFIAHPLHTEVVANIKCRDVIMSLLLALYALYCMFKYIETKKLKFVVMMALSYMFSIFSSESSITFLAVVPLILYCYTAVSVKKNVQITAVFFGMAALCILVRVMILGGVDGTGSIVVLDNFLVGAPDLMSRLATAVKGLGKYIALLIFPHPLTSDYSFNQLPVIGWTNLYAMLSLLFLLGAGIYALVKVKAKDHVAFGVLYFFITVSLFSNIIMLIGVGFAERLMYFPSLGFVMVLGHLLAKASKVEFGVISYEGITEVLQKNMKFVSVAGVILLGYSFKTISRNSAWDNNYSLYSTDVNVSTKSARMHYYYGLEITKVQAMDETDPQKKAALFVKGMEELMTATRIYPKYANAYAQIGITYYRMNDYSNAEIYCNEALKYDPSKTIVHSNLGSIYFNRGQYQKALKAFEKALKYDPRFSDAYMNIGSVYGVLKEYDKSIAAYKKAMEFDPHNATLYYLAGLTCQSMGDEANATTHFNKAYQLNPALRK
jgi:predicted negative regulator of RcsB-dependent stress response